MLILWMLWIVIGVLLCMNIPYLFFVFVVVLRKTHMMMPRYYMSIAIVVWSLIGSILMWILSYYLSSKLQHTKLSHYEVQMRNFIHKMDTILVRYIKRTKIVHRLLVFLLVQTVTPEILSVTYAKHFMTRAEYIVCATLSRQQHMLP